MYNETLYKLAVIASPLVGVDPIGGITAAAPLPPALLQWFE